VKIFSIFRGAGLWGEIPVITLPAKGFLHGKNKPILHSCGSKTVVKAVDDRSPMAKSFSKASEVTSISVMMIVPGLIGYWIDQKVGSVLGFTLLGLVLGMGVAVRQLMLLVSSPADVGQDSKVDSDEKSQQN